MHSLYLLTFSSGKCYVGQTVRTMNLRLQQHRAAARRGSDLPVHCAWRKHGEPKVDVLGEYETHEALHLAEIEAIASLVTLAPDGYNVGLGGETSPAVSPQVADKISQSAKGRKHTDTAPWSEAVRKRWEDADARERMVNGARAAWTPERRAAAAERSLAQWEKRRAEGWKVSEERKAKLRGRVFSEETRAKMSDSAKRRGAPKAAIAASAAASKGKKLGPYDAERIANVAAGVKAAWADPVKRERLMAARKAAWETRRKKEQS